MYVARVFLKGVNVDNLSDEPDDRTDSSDDEKMSFTYYSGTVEHTTEFTLGDVKVCKDRKENDHAEFMGDCKGKVEKCKSIGGEWMHESGNQNDSAFCKVKEGTEFDKHLCEKYGGRIDGQVCVSNECAGSEVAMKGQCFFKDYVKSGCKIAGCEQCLPSMVSCENCEDGKNW